MKKKLFLLIIPVLCACSNELKIEPTAQRDRFSGGFTYYEAFYLVSNYDDSKYDTLQKFVADEFIRINQMYDSIEYLQFDFYKKSWRTSAFLKNADPYGIYSPLLPENEHKYGRYFIEGIFYSRRENKKSNKWVHYSEHTDIEDTIVMKAKRNMIQKKKVIQRFLEL